MMRVLIVEDEPTLLENLAFQLEMEGYGVMQAADGNIALQLLNAAEDLPDIIVSDVAMPNVSGYELLEEVREQERLHDIPFIFLTAFNSANAILIGKELGVDDYLTKPFEIEDLVLAMENKLQHVAQIRQTAGQTEDTQDQETQNDDENPSN